MGTFISYTYIFKHIYSNKNSMLYLPGWKFPKSSVYSDDQHWNPAFFDSSEKVNNL